MNSTSPAIPATPATRAAGRNRTYRLVRQLHLWIGAWGAIAAIVYGFSGLVLNHRFGDAAWPQGDSAELGRDQFDVPAASRATPEELSLWLRATHDLDAQVIRKGPPGGNAGGGSAGADRRGAGNAERGGSRSGEGGGNARGGERGGERGQAPKWTLSGGTAREAWTFEYSPGAAQGELKRSAHSPLAAINRLHKGVGGGWVWILLADSFAIGMLLLGISGVWMWARGRRPRDMVLSVFAASVVVLLLVLVPALG